MTHLPRFKVEAAKDGRLNVSSAGSARQAFRMALEDVREGAETVSIATTDGEGELLEAFARVVGSLEQVVRLEPVSEGWDGYTWRFLFTAAEDGLLLELSSVAPVTAGVVLELPLGELEPAKGGRANAR